jgi:hypothetical protein
VPEVGGLVVVGVVPVVPVVSTLEPVVPVVSVLVVPVVEVVVLVVGGAEFAWSCGLPGFLRLLLAGCGSRCSEGPGAEVVGLWA